MFMRFQPLIALRGQINNVGRLGLRGQFPALLFCHVWQFGHVINFATCGKIRFIYSGRRRNLRGSSRLTRILLLAHLRLGG